MSENRESSTRSDKKISSLIGGEVLLIDDEAVVREIGCDMLKLMGIPCITAGNGEEGIRLFKEGKGKIALVILDVEMPGLTGDKVYDILKEINPDVKILLISGYTRNHLESKYFKRKIEHFMPKPFQLDQFSTKLKSVMDG